MLEPLSWMQPRDHRAAARTVSALAAVAVVVTVVFAPFSGQNRTLGFWPVATASSTLVLVAAISLLARVFDEASRLAWAMSPLLAVAAIVAVDLLTCDASVSAQIFFLFPTVYGATLLQRRGAVVMTSASVLGEAVVVLGRLPLGEAVTDIGYVGAALVTIAVFLLRGAERQAQLVARLERQAAVDPLTGLVTRRVLNEAATSALSGADSHEGTSLILVDVDEFKSVNDRYGHPAGDQVLVQLADLLTRRTRRGDVVCRMGGDEIALLLPGCSGEWARRRAEEILADVTEHTFTWDGPAPGTDHATVGVMRVSVSLGVAHAPTHAQDLRSLYAAADTALYEAKRSGRNRVVAHA